MAVHLEVGDSEVIEFSGFCGGKPKPVCVHITGIRPIPGEQFLISASVETLSGSGTYTVIGTQKPDDSSENLLERMATAVQNSLCGQCIKKMETGEGFIGRPDLRKTRDTCLSSEM